MTFVSSRRARVAWVLGALAVVGCAGCTPVPSATTASNRYQPDLSNAVEDARVAGAGSEQLAVVQAAVDAGSMSLANLETLLPALFGCLEAAGFTVRGVGHKEDIPGLPVPTYQLVPPDADLSITAQGELMQACYVRYYSEALGFYVSQPRAMDLYYADFEKRRPQIETCLRSHGMEVDSASTNDEVMRALTEDTSVSPCFDGDVMPFE